MFIGGFELSNPFVNFFNGLLDKFTVAFHSNLSSFNNGVHYIVDFFNTITRFISWLASYSGLSYEVVTIIFGLISAGVGIVISTYFIKLVLKWWEVFI